MALFPLYIDLTGRPCLVVGGGPVATRKIMQLLQFEAAVTVISPTLDEAIAQRVQQGAVASVPREFRTGDLEGCLLVIAATADRKVNDQVYQEASRKGIWVNVADQPLQCSFFFPGLVKRGELVIGISTSGTYPALSRKLREQLERAFPLDWEERLRLLEQFRNRVRAEGVWADQRREVLNQAADVALTGTLAQLETLLNHWGKAGL